MLCLNLHEIGEAEADKSPTKQVWMCAKKMLKFNPRLDMITGLNMG